MINIFEMDNLRGMLGMKKIDKVRNERNRDLCNVGKGVRLFGGMGMLEGWKKTG